MLDGAVIAGDRGAVSFGLHEYDDGFEHRMISDRVMSVYRNNCKKLPVGWTDICIFHDKVYGASLEVYVCEPANQ